MKVNHKKCDERWVNPLRIDHTCHVCEHGREIGVVLTIGNGEEMDRQNREKLLAAVDAQLADPCSDHREE